MTEREHDPERTSDDTMAFTAPGRPPPPSATQPLYVGSPPPPRGRQALIFALIFLLGLGGGFVLAQFIGNDDDRIPDADLVLYESATTTFPIEGAAFTRSTFDLQRQECDKDALKQFLRADPRRFRAWLDLQDITENQFDRFVDRLETRILTEPTAVTNHGCFAGGDGPCPFTIQSVLGPGTPVWFDPTQQRVVAKCTCSNPLKAPRCPPNCEDRPTPAPSPSPTPTTQTSAPTPPPTTAPTPPPTPAPTPTPTLPPSPSPVQQSPVP
jgi:hypothetical protein